MATKTSNQNVIAGLIVALLALAGLNIYQYINRNSLVAANKEQESEIMALDKAKTELDKEYYEALSDLEEMKSNNAELNQVIEGQKEELTKQKNRISSLLKDSRNLQSAREEIQNMRQKAEEYLAEITVLREENERLNIDNTILTDRNTALKTQVETTNTNLDEQEDEISEDLDEFLNSSGGASTSEDFTKDETASDGKSLKADYVEKV